MMTIGEVREILANPIRDGHARVYDPPQFWAEFGDRVLYPAVPGEAVEFAACVRDDRGRYFFVLPDMTANDVLDEWEAMKGRRTNDE
jgi:hypothetical protein